MTLTEKPSPLVGEGGGGAVGRGKCEQIRKNENKSEQKRKNGNKYEQTRKK